HEELARPPAGRQDHPQGGSRRHHRLLHQPGREREVRGQAAHSEGGPLGQHAVAAQPLDHACLIGSVGAAAAAAAAPSLGGGIIGMLAYPKAKVCAAHVAPVFLDASTTVAKATSLIAEAARAGARLIAFPESFVPGFPVWAGVQAPIKNHEYFKRLAANSIEVPGPHVQALCEAAREHAIVVSIGISERTEASVGCLW